MTGEVWKQRAKEVQETSDRIVRADVSSLVGTGGGSAAAILQNRSLLLVSGRQKLKLLLEAHERTAPRSRTGRLSRGKVKGVRQTYQNKD